MWLVARKARGWANPYTHPKNPFTQPLVHQLDCLLLALLPYHHSQHTLQVVP
jgi:hypothetical protein